MDRIVPDIQNVDALFHLFFYLEDKYGFEIRNMNGGMFLYLNCVKDKNNNRLAPKNDILKAVMRSIRHFKMVKYQ